MTVAGKFNFTGDYAAHQNASFERAIQLSASASAWVVSAYGAEMIVKKSHASNVTALELSKTNKRISFTNGNQINLKVSAGVMSAVASGNYVYDLFLTSATTRRLHILQGAFEITPEV